MKNKYILSAFITFCLSVSYATAQNANTFPQDGSWFTGFSSEKPTLLDVAFNGDGTAQDVSNWVNSGDIETRQPIETFGKPTTFWNAELGRFGMKNGCTWAGAATNYYRWKYTSDEWNRLQNNLSVEALVKMPGDVPNNNDEAKIIGSTQGGGFALMVWQKKIRFTIQDGTEYKFVTCPTEVEPGKMYHIVAMYGGMYDPKGVMRLYVNGVKVHELSGCGENIKKPSDASAHCVMIGADPTSKDGESAQGFPGEIYIARIFKDNLTDEHVSKLYNNIKVRNTDVTADLLDVVYDGRGYAYDVSPSKQTIKPMKALAQPNAENYVMEEITGVPSDGFTTRTEGGVWKTEFDSRYGRFTLNSDDVKYDDHGQTTETNRKCYGHVPQHFYGIDYRNDYNFKLTQLNGFSMELVVNDHQDLTEPNDETADEAKWFASTENGGTAMLTGDQTTGEQDRNTAFIVKTTGKDHYIGTKILATDAMGEIGAHYAAEIGREEGNTMKQTIEGLPKGWYRVSCQGFVTGGGKANLIANRNSVELQPADYDNVIKPNKTVQQQTIIDKEQKIDNCQQYNDNVAAATLFDADPRAYNNEVWVYVGDDGKLTIGMEKVTDEGRAFVDNFQLAYGGDVKEIYLSATKTAQEPRDKAVYTDPMRFTLRRAFAKDTWNALSLPVSIPADQLKANFQADETQKMKLYKLEGIDANRKTLIRFRKVDLDKADSEGLVADECYVIWPTKIAPTYDKNNPYTYTFPEVTNNVYNSVAVTTYDPLYHFEGVKAPGYEATATKNYGTASGTLKYTAYYDKPVGGVSGKFYMVEDGVMYYATKCDWLYASYWILEDVDNVNQSKDFTMLFDDETTGIGSVESQTPADRRIYNLNGQMMGEGDTKSLNKGVYIVNGRKVVVR